MLFQVKESGASYPATTILVIEYCAQGNLQKSIESGGKLGDLKISDFIFQMCSALSYLAEKNIVHRYNLSSYPSFPHSLSICVSESVCLCLSVCVHLLTLYFMSCSGCACFHIFPISVCYWDLKPLSLILSIWFPCVGRSVTSSLRTSSSVEQHISSTTSFCQSNYLLKHTHTVSIHESSECRTIDDSLTQCNKCSFPH